MHFVHVGQCVITFSDGSERSIAFVIYSNFEKTRTKLLEQIIKLKITVVFDV